MGRGHHRVSKVEHTGAGCNTEKRNKRQDEEGGVSRRAPSQCPVRGAAGVGLPAPRPECESGAKRSMWRPLITPYRVGVQAIA